MAARMTHQPALYRRGLMGAVIVEKITVPVLTLSAANRLMVPWRA